MPDPGDPGMRDAALARIRENITRSGVHVYSILGGGSPGFSYTIGLYPSVGAELLFPRSALFSVTDSYNVLMALFAASGELAPGASFPVESLGTFQLQPAEESWTREMIRGARDYYDAAVPAWQVVPPRRMIDVPDMRRPLEEAPAWRWLHTDWAFPVPEASKVLTGLDVLEGAAVTEAYRSEPEEWQLFAEGTDPESGCYSLPLGVLLGVDPSLSPLVEMEVGARLVRGGPGQVWQPDDH